MNFVIYTPPCKHGKNWKGQGECANCIHVLCSNNSKHEEYKKNQLKWVHENKREINNIFNFMRKE